MICSNYVKINTKKFFMPSFSVVIFVAATFAIVHRSFANQLDLNYFEYLLEVFTHQKMILYLMFIFYVFAITKTVTVVTSQELIRFGSFSRYALNFLVSVIAIASAYILMFLVLYGIAGIGLSFENVFGNSVATLPELSAFGCTPVVLLILSLFHIILFLVSVTMIHKVIFTLFNYKTYIVSVIGTFVVLIFAMTDTAFHWIFELEAYMSSLNAFYYLQEQFYWYYIIEILVILTCILLLKYKWNRQNVVKVKQKFPLKSWVLKNYVNRKNLLALTVLIVMNCLYVKTISYSVESFGESSLETYAFYMFGGYPFYGLEVMDLVSFLMIICIPLFFICKYLETLNSSKIIPYIVRFRDKRKVVGNFISSSILYIGLCYVIYLTILLASVVVFNFDVTNFETLSGGMLVGSTALKFLEIVFMFYLVTILFTLTKNSTLSFITIVIGYALTAMSFGIVTLNPFGLSSINRWVEYDYGFGKVLIFFIVMIGIMHVIMKKILSNKFV